MEKAQVYEEFKEKVEAYLRGKLNNADLAEELCSEVFLKVYERIDEFDRERASLSTWIYTITRNTLTDYYRTRRVHEELPELLVSEDNSIEDDLCSAESLEILADALEKLDERERDIVLLHYYSELTLKEIADKMEISYAYAKVLHNKALSALKKFF